MTHNYNEIGTYAIQTEEGLILETCRTKFYARMRKKELEKQLKCELELKRLKR